MQFILTNESVAVEGDVAWVTVDENLIGETISGTVAALNMFVFDGQRWRMVVHHGAARRVALDCSTAPRSDTGGGVVGRRRRLARSRLRASTRGQSMLMRSTTNQSVAFGSMPGRPAAPYARSGGMPSRRCSPTFIPGMPCCQPGMTSPSWNDTGCPWFHDESKILPSRQLTPM